MKKILLIYLLVIFCCFHFSVDITGQKTIPVSTQKPIIMNKVSSSPAIVSITNNSGLMLYSYTGNGTVYNPYRIGNFVINNCSIGATGNRIHNTNA